MHFFASALLIGSALSGALALPSTSKPAADSLVFRSDAPTDGGLTCSAYPSKPSKLEPGKYFKITMLVKKLANITDEYFHAYWDTCSIPLALDCKAFTDNVEKYYSQHQTPALKAELGALGYPMADYDGITEVWVKDLQAWQKVVDSECWDGVRKDALTFTQWPYTFMYTYEVKGIE